MQTIIGAGGAIGLPLAKELSKTTKNIRLVGRNTKKVNPDDSVFPLDAKNFEASINQSKEVKSSI